MQSSMTALAGVVITFAEFEEDMALSIGLVKGVRGAGGRG